MSVLICSITSSGIRAITYSSQLKGKKPGLLKNLSTPFGAFLQLFLGAKTLINNIGAAYTMQQVITMSSQATQKTRDILRADVFLLGVLPVAKLSDETIGQRIGRFRKEKGLTQKELAEALGVSQPVVSDYEKDVIRIPADMVVEIAKTLKVSGDEILGLASNKKQTSAIKNRRLSRRLQDIDKLPKRDQDALFRTIDAFISKS